LITFNTSIGSFEIPSSLSDLTVGKLALLRANVDNPIVVWHELTGFPIEKLALLDLDPLTHYLDFLKTGIFEQVDEMGFIPFKVMACSIETREEVEVVKIYDLPEDITFCTFGQKLLASDAIGEGDIIEMLAIYLQPVYDDGKFDNDRIEPIKEMLQDVSVEDAYSCIKYLKNQLETILANEAKMLKPEISHEQRLAGIDIFNALGYFNTIDMLAGGDVLKYEEVLNVDYNTIYSKLLHTKFSAKFEKKYHEVLNRKK